MTYVFMFLISAAWLSARAVRVDDDADAAPSRSRVLMTVIEAEHVRADGSRIVLQGAKEEKPEVAESSISVLPIMELDATSINGTNMSTEPFILPASGVGGKIIKNVGCSKNLRKTLVSTEKPSFDVKQCAGLAAGDNDCGSTVYIDATNCVCVIKGKECDVITIPGNTMFVPTTTAMPNPLKPTPKDECGKRVFLCTGAEWLATSEGDIPGAPYALGHTDDLKSCRSKCCEDPACQAIKYSPDDRNMKDVLKDNCALYLNATKYDRNLTMDRNFTVHLIYREPSEKEEEEAGYDPVKKNEFDRRKANEAQVKADETKKAFEASKKKMEAAQKMADNLEAIADMADANQTATTTAAA